MADTTHGRNSGHSAPPARRGRAGKRAAVTRAARVVFGRDGYSRSSIDAIATEADVSTRTIYNHFENKEDLFTQVLLESATQVADAFSEWIEAAAGDPATLESRLVGLGHALAAQRTDFPEHFAMVRQINAEAGHFPGPVLDAWQRAGPLRVQGEVAQLLQGLADGGLLQLQDAATAAVHFIALTNGAISARSFGGVFPLAEEEIDDAVKAGVGAFLNGYGRRG